MKKIFIILLVSLIFGCDMVKELNAQQEQAESYIYEKYDLDSSVGFNYTNGNLMDVTLVLDANDVDDKLVSELKVMANSMASEVFEQEPRAIYIQLY